VRRSLSSVRLFIESRFQLPLVPDYERHALGVPSRLDSLRRRAAGTRGHSRSRHLRLQERHRRRVRFSGDERVPREVGVLVELLRLFGELPLAKSSTGRKEEGRIGRRYADRWQHLRWRESGREIATARLLLRRWRFRARSLTPPRSAR